MFPAMTSRMAEGDAEDYVFELGDKVAINTARFGAVRGRIYYRDADLIRIMPDGVSDRLYDYPLKDEAFVPELGFKVAEWISKATLDGFVNQHDLQAGQFFETFTADGEIGPTFRIESVSVDDDSIIVKDDTGADVEIDFSYIGIPLDLPFAVIRVREQPTEAEIAAANDTSVSLNVDDQAEDEAYTGIATGLDSVIAEMNEQTASAAAIDEARAEGEAFDEGDLVVEMVGYIHMQNAPEKAQIIPTYQRSYPDAMQRDDALQDFTSFLSINQQRNVSQLRRIRQLTETLHTLKKQLVNYDPSTDTVIGFNPQSAQFLSELFDLTHVPLRRPVLDVKLKVYEYVDSTHSWSLDGASLLNKTVEHAFEYAKKSEVSWDEVNTIVNNIVGEESITANQIRDEDKPSILIVQQWPAFWQSMHPGANQLSTNFWVTDRSSYNRVGRPFVPADEESNDIYIARQDSEFFRAEIPDIEMKNVEGLESGVITTGKTDPSALTIGEVNFSLRRTLGPIYRKTATAGLKEVYINAESAPVKADILFPLRFKGSLGTPRSGFFLNDYIQAQETLPDMQTILAEAGAIAEAPQANSILALGIGGNTLGNIKVSNFIEPIRLQGLGISNMLRILSQYGLTNIELNIETAEVLFKKVSENINTVKGFLKKLRDEINESSVVDSAPAADILLDEVRTWMIDQIVENDPILADLHRKFKSQSPNLAKSDYALLSYIYTKEPDLFMAMVGETADQVAREKLYASLRIHLKATMELIARQALQANQGLAPQPNTCEHVARLELIKKIPELSERMYHLTQFFIRYQGERRDNYINCSICSRELICVHTLLEMEMHNNPQDREVLRKELLLNFCGPVYGNSYTCRNCGQHMGEIEYDNNIQFDDEGRPIMGRAEIVDRDAIAKENFEQATDSVAPEDSKELDFGSPLKNSYYKVFKEITDLLAIYPSKEDYANIIRQLEGSIGELRSREEYILEAREIVASGGKKPIDYDVYLSRNIVIYAAVHLLIHIQTRIPSYQMIFAYPGCKNPGFGGYPLKSDEEDLTGIEYMACVLSSIMKNTDPWNMTLFQREPDARRLKVITANIYTIMKRTIGNAEVQQLLVAKRRHNAVIYGGLGQKEEISNFFLPPQKIITADDAIKAETVIIPEVKSHMTVAARSDIWIQKANEIVDKVGHDRAELIIGSPFSEASCCYGPIQKPRDFWMQSDLGLPELPPRLLQMGALTTRMLTRFVPRSLPSVLLSAPEEFYYVLFLNVCYRGQRKGLPHEFGYNYRCPHCELQIVPFDLKIDEFAKQADFLQEQQKYRDNAQSSLESQGVEINNETFQDLLNASHQRYAVEPYRRPASMGLFDALRSIALLYPAPMDHWTAIMEDTISNFSKLTKDATTTDIVEAISRLSKAGGDAYRENIQSRLPAAEQADIQEIVTLSPSEVAEILLTYFILPFERLVNGVDPSVLTQLPMELIEMISPGSTHYKDINDFINDHNAVIRQFHSAFAGNKGLLAKAKLLQCVEQYSQVVPLLQKIMITKLPGGERTYKYLIQAMVYGPLAKLLDPNYLPSEGYTQSALAASADTGSIHLVHSIVVATLRKYRREKLSYSEEMIQQLLQDRLEKEKMLMIKGFDVLTDEEKAVLSYQKKNGLGPFAVGGTKAIRIYDEDRYEKEKVERAQAGFTDFSFENFDPSKPIVPGGRQQTDDSGYSFGQDEVGQGYDTARVDDDNY